MASRADATEANGEMDARLAAVTLGVVALLLFTYRSPLLPLVPLFCVGVGACALAFHAAGFPCTDPAVLLLGLLFLVALGVDYTIFLMGRAREEAAARGHRSGVLAALQATGGVITSAGLVLAATFSVFLVTPVVLNIQLGALVAVGVMIDTFIVRTLLVQGDGRDVGARTWWPSHLPTSNELA